MLVKTFENNGKTISKNIVKLNLKQYSNLYCLINWSTYVQTKHVFDKPVNDGSRICGCTPSTKRGHKVLYIYFSILASTESLVLTPNCF